MIINEATAHWEHQNEGEASIGQAEDGPDGGGAVQDDGDAEGPSDGDYHVHSVHFWGLKHPVDRTGLKMVLKAICGDNEDETQPH